MDFRVTDVVTEQDRREVYEGLLEYNLSKIEDKNPRELGVYLEDESGRKIAGLIGDTHGNWLMVKYLWVDKAQRGKKIGSQILEQYPVTGKRYYFTKNL